MAKEAIKTKPVLTAIQKAAAKQAAFNKVVEPRVGKALKAIRLIANCTSANYAYKPEQAACIVAALEGAVLQVKDAFAKKVQKQGEFVLPA